MCVHHFQWLSSCVLEWLFVFWNLQAGRTWYAGLALELERLPGNDNFVVIMVDTGKVIAVFEVHSFSSTHSRFVKYFEKMNGIELLPSGELELANKQSTIIRRNNQLVFVHPVDAPDFTRLRKDEFLYFTLFLRENEDQFRLIFKIQNKQIGIF